MGQMAYATHFRIQPTAFDHYGPALYFMISGLH
jgi:hypothetical protein